MTVALVLLLSGAGLVLSTRTLHMLAAYVAIALTISFLVAASASTSLLSLVLLAIATLLKVFVAPVGIVAFVRANPDADNLRPSLSAPLRLLLVLAFAIVSRTVAHVLGPSVPLQSVLAFIVLCGVGVLIVHRNLLAHVVGLLVLGAGVTLIGSALAPSLPESVEFGATFDALVSTFIGLALLRAYFAHNPLLDVESLRRLRG